MSNILDTPDPLLPFSEKLDKQYGLKTAKYLWSGINKGRSFQNMFYSGRDKYRENIDYMQGQNSIDKFKEKNEKGEPENNTWVNLDWTMHKHLTRHANNAINRLTQEEYTPSCQAIDPWSQDIRDKTIAMVKEYKRNPLFYENIEKVAGQVISDDVKELAQIDDQDELKAQLEMKLRLGMNMEKAIKLVHEYNDYNMIKSMGAIDLVANGVKAELHELDPDGIIRIKYLDPARLIVPISNREDFSDITMCGYYHDNITLYDIKKLDPTLSNEDLKRIWGERYPNEAVSFDQDRGIGSQINLRDGKLGNVLQFWFLTDKEESVAFVRDKDGNIKVRPVDLSRGASDEYITKYSPTGVPYRTNGKRDIYRRSIQMCITGYWIVDTDILIGYGVKTNMERAAGNLYQTTLPVRILAPSMKNGKVTSLVDMGKSVADEIQLLRLKAQSLLAGLNPDGAYIDLDALESANIAGASGQKMSPRETLSLYFQKGVVVGRSRGLDNRGGNGLPVTTLNGSTADKFLSVLNAIAIKLGELKEIFSMPDVATGGTINPEIGKRVSELAIQGSETAIMHLYMAQRRMYLRSCRSIANLYPDCLELGGAKYMARALGYDNVQFDKDNMYLSIQEFSVTFRLLPSNADWERFYQEVYTQIGQSITMGDYLYLKNIDNMKEAEFTFRRLEKIRAKERQQEAAALQEQNAMVQSQAAEMKGQVDIAVMEKEKELETHKSQLKMLEIQEEGNQQERLLLKRAELGLGVPN